MCIPVNLVIYHVILYVMYCGGSMAERLERGI